MVKNDQGQIAIKRLRQGQKLVQLSNGKAYVFVPKNNISLAWVDEEDVPTVMNIKRACCGGGNRKQFFYALEHDIRRWNFGGR